MVFSVFPLGQALLRVERHSQMPELRRWYTLMFSEFRFWSVIHDQEMIRLSMVDARNGEFFLFLPADDGRKYRARRDEALETLQGAINAGLDPGEVLPI